MDLNEQKEFEKFFKDHPELADELINNASKILDIDDQIRGLPKDQPTLEHRVPGGSSGKTFGKNYERTIGLQNEIIKIRTAFNVKAFNLANYTDLDKQKRFTEFIDKQTSDEVLKTQKSREVVGNFMKQLRYSQLKTNEKDVTKNSRGRDIDRE